MKFQNAAPVAAMLMAASLAGCGQGQQQTAQNLPTVTVAKPAQRTVVDLDEYVGRFVAVNSVDIVDWCNRFADRIEPDALIFEVDGDASWAADVVAAAPVFTGL